MKKLLLFVLLVVISCDKDDNNIKNPLVHYELGFELDEPDIILNEIAKGELDKSINSILLLMYGNTERKWEFEYIENTDKISKMIYYKPHYQACEKDVFQFYYNSQNLIDSVVSKRKNYCNEFEVIRTYTFNYNNNGLLKSVFMDDKYSVSENYFGYYPNGKIKEIYNSVRDTYGISNLGIQKFKYNDSFTNVTEVEHISGSNYHYIYKYYYDNNQNPFKSTFIYSGVFMPHIGPAYLSENNVITMIERNVNNINGYEFTNDYLFNYSNENTLLNYHYSNNERVYTINQ